MVGSAPQFTTLETESAPPPSRIAAKLCRKTKKRENAESANSRRRALTGGSASFVVKKGTPPVGLEPTTQRLTADCRLPRAPVARITLSGYACLEV